MNDRDSVIWERKKEKGKLRESEGTFKVQYSCAYCLMFDKSTYTIYIYLLNYIFLPLLQTTKTELRFN